MELRDCWYEDLKAGEVFETSSHLMEEERMISFATEFDPQRFHVDPVAAQDTIYGGLIASGWHTGSIMMKLLAANLGPSSLGSPGLDRIRWTTPVRPGDRLRLRITILDKRLSASKPDRGLLFHHNELFNQDDVVVMSVESTMFLLRRPVGM